MMNEGNGGIDRLIIIIYNCKNSYNECTVHDGPGHGFGEYAVTHQVNINVALVTSSLKFQSHTYMQVLLLNSSQLNLIRC